MISPQQHSQLTATHSTHTNTHTSVKKRCVEITKLNIAGDAGPSADIGTLFQTSEYYLGVGMCEAQALSLITVECSGIFYSRKSAGKGVR